MSVDHVLNLLILPPKNLSSSTARLTDVALKLSLSGVLVDLLNPPEVVVESLSCCDCCLLKNLLFLIILPPKNLNSSTARLTDVTLKLSLSGVLIDLLNPSEVVVESLAIGIVEC